MPKLLAKAEAIRPGTVLLSSQAHILHIHSGWRSLHTIVPRVDDCMLLIPLSIPSSMMLMIWEEDVSDTKADVTLQEDTALLIAGKCKLWVGPRDQGSVGSEPSALSLQCIVFCLSGVY